MRVDLTLQFLFLIAFRTERTKTQYEFLKVNGSVTVLVEEFDDTRGERVAFDAGDSHEFLFVDITVAVFIHFHESLAQSLNLFWSNYRTISFRNNSMLGASMQAHASVSIHIG